MDPSESAANKAEQTGGKKYITRIYSTNQLEKIPFPTKESFVFVVTGEINYLDVEGDYTTFHLLDHSKIIIIKSMSETMKMLPSKTFFRIHDNCAVNGNQCKEYFKREFHLEMENGVVLKVAEKRAVRFIEFFLKIKRRFFK